MVDQLALVEATTPAPGAGVGATTDFTDGSITEPFKAAIILYSATDSDDTDETHARAGISLISVEPGDTKIYSQCVLSRNGLAAPDNRTSRILFRVPRASAFPTQYDLQMNLVGAISGGVQLETTVDPVVRTKAAALLFAGTGMRSWLTQVTATTTLQNENTGPLSPSDTRFRPDLLVVLAMDGASGGQIDDACMHLGFVVDDGTPTQVCAFTDWDDATEPSDTDGELRSANGAAALSLGGGRATRILVTFGITTTGFTHQTNTADVPLWVLAVKFEGEHQKHVGHHELDASSPQSFEMPFDPAVVLAMSTRLASIDAADGTSLAGSFGLSLFGPGFQRAYSARFQQGNSGTSAASSRQGDHAVLTLDHLGNVAQRGSYVGPAEPHGVELSFPVAGAGHLTLLALAPVGVLTPDAVEILVEAMDPVLAGTISPDAVEIVVEVPAPKVSVSIKPAAVEISVEVPAVTLLAIPVIATPPAPEPLDPLYIESMQSLLPRGLAWPRRPA